VLHRGPVLAVTVELHEPGRPVARRTHRRRLAG
jgi:hypothetical protein